MAERTFGADCLVVARENMKYSANGKLIDMFSVLQMMTVLLRARENHVCHNIGRDRKRRSLTGIVVQILVNTRASISS